MDLPIAFSAWLVRNVFGGHAVLGYVIALLIALCPVGAFVTYWWWQGVAVYNGQESASAVDTLPSTTTTANPVAPPTQAPTNQQTVTNSPGSINIVGDPTFNINQDRPQQLPTEQEVPSFREKIETVEFSLGEGGITAGYSVDSLRKGGPIPFRFGNFIPVTLRMDGDKLLFTFKLWSGDGKPPIEVENNEFKIRPPHWERNFNANALEVVDENQTPIFQMIRKTPSHIVVNGVFPVPGGGLWVFGPDGARGLLREIPSDFKLTPLFKYPAWKYPGQYAEL